MSRSTVTYSTPSAASRACRLSTRTEPVVVSGAITVAKGAMAATGRARFTGLALLDGTVGLVMAPLGRLRLVLTFAIADDGHITGIDVIADPDRLGELEVAALDS